MPTSDKLASSRRISPSIRPLAQGQTTADLQRALAFLQFRLEALEVKAERFGRSTRAALTAFQSQQNLPPTGRVDSPTAARLNDVLAARQFFQVTQRPFRDRQVLRLTLRDKDRLDGEARTFVQQRLNQELKEAILRELEAPSDALTTAVLGLSLDYEAVSDHAFGTVIIDQVLPALLDHPGLEQELARHSDRGFPAGDETVAARLMLDRDLRHHPLFAEEARRSKNAALGAIARLTARQAQSIEDLDLDTADDDTWNRLVGDGVLTEQRRDDLRGAVEFAKLSDDRFELIEALHRDRKRRPRDLVVMDQSDWKTLLTREQIAPPDGDSLDTYVHLLDLNVQQAFRTPYLMHRVAERTRDDVVARIADVEPLLARNDRLFVNGRLNESLDLTDIAENERPRHQESLRELNRFANTYRHLGIAEVLNDRNLSTAEKERAIRGKQELLQTFHRSNPDLDLEWLTFFNVGARLDAAFQPNWRGIAEGDRPLVQRTMMALQRAQSLTDSATEAESLLAAGLDSGIAILEQSEAEFGRRVGLPSAAVSRIYRKAGARAVWTGHALSLVEEVTTHAPFAPAVLNEGSAGPNLDLVNVLKDIDGYEDLFGSQNHCRCRHCRSIFGPAAYFVDLMDFIDRHVSRPVFVEGDKTDHPLHLKNRRGDLWTLVLSCRNTETKVPYLTIVNEVLERYLERVFEEDDIYEALTEARLSFHQPFNLPFQALLLHLGHFRIALSALYELFALPDADLARARLDLAPEELATIVSPGINSVLPRYDIPPAAPSLSVGKIVARAGLSRDELGRLMKLAFIRGGLFLEVTSANPLGESSGVDDTMSIRSTSNGPALAAGNAFVQHFLDRLHRFCRLRRRLPWNVEELHLVLTSLADATVLANVATGNTIARTAALGVALNVNVVVDVANLRKIQEAFGASVEELLALYHEIPRASVAPDRASLFVRLFGAAETLRIQHPALNNSEPDDESVSSDFGLLQGALRLSEAQVLELLPIVLTPAEIENAVLRPEHLSALYRHAALGRLMGLGPDALARLQDLLDLPRAGGRPTERIRHILTLVRFKAALDETPFSVSDVRWMVAGEVSDDAGPQITQAEVDDVLERTREDPLRFFSPESLAEIEGINLPQAQAIVATLAEEALGWLARPDPSQERYRVTPAVALAPDLDPLVTFFVGAGDSADVAARKAGDLQQELARHHPHAVFVAHLAEHFNINRAYLEALRPFLTTDPADEAFVALLFEWLEAADGTETHAVMELMQGVQQRLHLFQARLGLSTLALSFVAAHPDIFSIALPFGVTWDSLRRLGAFKALLPTDPADATILHQVLTSWSGHDFPETAWPSLARVLKTGLAQVRSLLGNFTLPAAAVDALLMLENATRLTSKLGLNGAALKQLTARDYAGLTIANNLVEGAIRSKYDQEQDWADAVEPYVDKLNEIKRDALVDRILSKEFQLKFTDARELYQFFLLDVEMEGCARTSRVLEAISACQLYVHRCRMNLEQSTSGDVKVLPSTIPADEWLWRKNYRVWEANRKVFLYPENWLEPDLRDNKTPIFEQAGGELLQSTTTPAAIEKIYRNYLREYAELARLTVVSTLYDDNDDAYWFFARTPGKPYQYYWRRLVRKVEWTPWRKVELDIEPATVSAHKHHGKLYLFWMRLLTSNDKYQEHERRPSIEDNQTLYLEYSSLEPNLRWTAPARLPFHKISVLSINNDFSGEMDDISAASVNPGADPGKLAGFSKTRLKTSRHYDKVYLHTAPNDPLIRVFHYYAANKVISGHLNEYANQIERRSLFWTPNVPLVPFYVWNDVVKVYEDGNFPLAAIVVTGHPESSFLGEVACEDSLHTILQLPKVVTNLFPSHLQPRARIVHNSPGDTILDIAGQQLFVRYLGGAGYKKQLNSLLEAVIAYASRRRDTIRLSTTLADTLGEILFNRGLEQFLSLESQGLVEAPLRHVDFEWLAEFPPPIDSGTQGHLNFSGAQGPYYEELFFHLPFLIAHYLNASQKFADADYWYRRVFDPTASENPAPANRTDRNWRYIQFRNRTVPRLRDILTDEAAIERYQDDPFNPFAIARLRIVAFQKAVVMKYVDNLLDWGDQLFAQDTVESINEATMLYVMAADILGSRPVELGDCETTTEFLLTYQNIQSRERSGSEFLIELENLYLVIAYLNFVPPVVLGPDGTGGNDNLTSAGFVALRSRNVALKPYHLVKAAVTRPSPMPTALPAQFKVAARTSTDSAVHRSLAFCVPPNDTLLGYWDRVDDRLFKIRNCMNLQGVRRELALFQPPIDPGLLVKAKAAGLSLEDVLGLLNADVPAYRFTYILGKAKEFAGTVQSFGRSLLDALEKKDAEELSLLRAVHEQELLKAVRRVKEAAVGEADHHHAALLAGRALATTRKEYYKTLLADPTDPALAISKNEQDSLGKQEEAREKDVAGSKLEQGASGIHAAPSIGFQFSPFIFALPFNPLGESPLRSHLDPLTISASTGQFAQVLSAIASKFQSEASSKNVESSRAATRGGHERRKQEWQHQQALAELDEKQFDEQLRASSVRIDLARKDLETHDKQASQAKELHDLYSDKFTNLGLYTHLASSLSRLHREAYNLAHDMAMKAQRAFRFETDDQTFFIGADNWQADKAGLLAGERLALQLQQMDKAYFEQTRREYEITLPCSVAQIDPRALIDLRETGRCDFSLPEVWFDLYYPGQYKRRIKSVRLTIPCVTGPYTNVSAKLTLTGSRIRPEPQLSSELVGVLHQRNTSVAASSASNDPGVFELSFQDERYVPFEGAGAVSDWHLELPSTFRPFDYDSISDVILHISYVAKDDGRYKEDVEGDLASRFERLAADTGLARWFSMKREFGSAFHRLRHPSPGASRTTDIRLDKRHFPYFLRNRDVTIEQVMLIVAPAEGQVLNVDDLELRLNDLDGSDWLPFPNPDAQPRAKTFALGEPLSPTGNQWTITFGEGDISAVDDLWILVAYTV